MSKLKKALLMGAAYVLVTALAIGGTVAYLNDTDSDVNVMTLGNVSIEQLEYQRVVNDDGTFKTTTIDEKTSYVLEEFEQAKPLYPSFAQADAEWDTTTVRLSQVDSRGGMDVFTNALAQDKFVFVKNTGKSDAYVRTIIAFEAGEATIEEWNDLIGTSNHFTWDDPTSIGIVSIDGNNYAVIEYVYKGWNDDDTRHAGGILPAGETTYNSLAQVYMKSHATNEDVAKLDGNDNGTYDILVLSQAVQAKGFDNAATALNAGFGEANATNVQEWFTGMYIPNYSLEEATIENGVITVPADKAYVLSGTQNSVTVKGEGTLYLRDLNITAATEGSALTLAENSTVKLVIENNVTLKGATGGSGIYVPANTKLDLSGKGGSLTAIGNNGADDDNGGHGIGGEGTIYIHDLNELTAEGWGKAGFGIGGNTATITIENTNITYTKGGYVQPNFVNDTSYGKTEPEGGAAIGSSYCGAVITLNNVTIDKAEGGSKSAAIGARYWTGVTINIDDCTIKNALGGNASAGIGGSRVPKDPTDAQYVTININNSNVTAVGGEFGAGIGSGYDTHCNLSNISPLHTINIIGNSVINAQGGRQAAGIGTGYHVGGLAGKIESSVTVNATAGAPREKYTIPMDVGFGVVDLSKEGFNNSCTFDYMGTTININSTESVSSN